MDFEPGRRSGGPDAPVVRPRPAVGQPAEGGLSSEDFFGPNTADDGTVDGTIRGDERVNRWLAPPDGKFLVGRWGGRSAAAEGCGEEYGRAEKDVETSRAFD